MFFDDNDTIITFLKLLDMPDQERKTVLSEIIDPANSKFALSAVNWLRDLRAIGTLAVVDQDLLYTHTFTVKIGTLEDISILHEILVAGEYNIYINRPTVLLDIGMNVGISSLYFAAKQNILKVIGFEPVKETYGRAQRNVALNEGLGPKIQGENIGWGSVARTIEIDVSSERPGVAGIYGCRGFADLEKDNISKTTINIANADEIVRSARRQFDLVDPSIQIVAKIDCEGSEYEIIECLCTNGSINLLSSIIMEWHWIEKDTKQPSVLVELLSKSGYDVICRAPFSKSGMIYAFKK